jgi:D-tyrosyl-tRNA(Tyr) deacylase
MLSPVLISFGLNNITGRRRCQDGELEKHPAIWHYNMYTLFDSKILGEAVIMRFVIQRVTESSVTVDEKVIGKIGKGFMVLIGIADGDTREMADKLVSKMVKLRIFDDADGKTNLSLADVGGSLLLISQFTLYADCRKGNRPGFTNAGAPDFANEMYEYIIEKAEESVPVVEKGEFGALMYVSLVNDGPFTVILDSDEICR